MEYTVIRSKRKTFGIRVNEDLSVTVKAPFSANRSSIEQVLADNERWINRSIARHLGISRHTVNKYCRGDTHPHERKPYHRDSEVVTEDVIEFVRACLKEDQEENLSKQWHTAKRIYDRLVTEKGFKGGESTIRNVVRSLREIA